MIKKLAFSGALILCTLLLVYCTTDEESMIGPFGDASKYISATSFTVENDVLYTGGDSTTIKIVLLDYNKSPLEGLKVLFSAEFGEITESDITDSTGTAEAVFKSDETTGETIIIANTGTKSFEIPITIKKYEPTTIELSAESLVLLADGNDYTKITATPRDEDGNIMSNIAIQFATTSGTLSSEAGSFSDLTSLEVNSGSTGEEAIVYLRSEPSIGNAEITASAGETSSINIYFYLNVPEYIILTPSPKVLLADGNSISTISAVVLDDTGTEMEGVAVSFSTTAGSLDFPVRTTDENGIAIVELTSSTVEETATVTASAYATSTIDIQFTLNIPYQIELNAAPTRVIADGSTASIITAIPKDRDGNPMPGIEVSFNADLGTLGASFVKTDSDGIAEVELTSNEEGTATVTASVSTVVKTTKIIFYEYNPAFIILSRGEDSILADGFSKVLVTATVYDADNQAIPGAVVNFSTNYGSLDKTDGVVASQEGAAVVTLTSEGLTEDEDAVVTAEVEGVSLSNSITVTFRGITLTANIDSTKFTEGGYYSVFIRSTLIETSQGTIVDDAAVRFSTTIGAMEPEISAVNDFGEATSILYAEVTGTDQNGLVITSELTNSSVVSDATQSSVVPGVEALVSTIDDEVMGDGKGFALMRATIREATTNKAITDVTVDWATTHGTIKPTSTANTLGHTIDTLAIEFAVGSETDVTVEASFGSNVSVTNVVTFIPPVNDNRLILGFEPDTTGHGIVPCDIDTSIATRDAGLTAHYVNESGNGIDGEAILFSVVPNNLSAICDTDTTDGNQNGKASVMMAYPPQNIGQIVRVWAEAPDGTRGSVDVILPKHEEEEEDEGG